MGLKSHVHSNVYMRLFSSSHVYQKALFYQGLLLGVIYKVFLFHRRILTMSDYAPPPNREGTATPCNEPAPAMEQDVAMEGESPAMRLSSTSSRHAPENAGAIWVPTRLATLSSLYGTSRTSQCTSLC